MLDGGESLPGTAAHRLGGAVRRDQLGVLGLERLQLPLQRVVLRVADLGTVLPVIERVVAADLAAKRSMRVAASCLAIAVPMRLACAPAVAGARPALRASSAAGGIAPADQDDDGHEPGEDDGQRGHRRLLPHGLRRCAPTPPWPACSGRRAAAAAWPASPSSSPRRRGRWRREATAQQRQVDPRRSVAARARAQRARGVVEARGDAGEAARPRVWGSRPGSARRRRRGGRPRNR